MQHRFTWFQSYGSLANQMFVKTEWYPGSEWWPYSNMNPHLKIRHSRFQSVADLEWNTTMEEQIHKKNKEDNSRKKIRDTLIISKSVKIVYFVNRCLILSHLVTRYLKKNTCSTAIWWKLNSSATLKPEYERKVGFNSDFRRLSNLRALIIWARHQFTNYVVKYQKGNVRM